MKLNLGCGKDIREGYINVDMRPLPGVNCVHDLNKYPWPFEDNSAEEILALDIMEHLEDVVAAMDECHRILRPGGRLKIRVPMAGNAFGWTDPTHRRLFTVESFDFFCPGTVWGDKYDYGKGKWRKVAVQVAGALIFFELEPLGEGNGST